MTVWDEFASNLKPPAWMLHLTARGVGIAAGVGAGFLTLLLISHVPSDPSFWTAHGGDTRNWMGALGANLSAFLVMAFGRAAWLIPLALTIWSWRLLKGHWSQLVAVPLRLVPAGLIALVASAAFLSAWPTRLPSFPSLHLGGWVGDRAILPFARLFDGLGLAPYQIPGLAMALLALGAFAVATGATREEARGLWAYIRASFRDVWAWLSGPEGESGEHVMVRSNGLKDRLRRTAGIVPNPPRLDGDVSLRAPMAVSPAPPQIDDFADPSDGIEDDFAYPGDAQQYDSAPAAPAPMQAQTRSAPPRAEAPRQAADVRPGVQQRLPLYGPERADRLLDLLAPPRRAKAPPSELELNESSAALLNTLGDYGVKGDMLEAKYGPVVTLHEFEPAPGTKAARVVGLADDIARSMSAISARVAPIRGRSVIGIELPNEHRETVYLREIMERAISDEKPLPLALGKGIDGSPKIASLAKMPHLLIAGTTGSGKSVSLNAMILSLLYRHPPEECRLIMIDPKMLELSVYDGIPHLMAPVVTDPKKAVMALKWVVGEMESRYQRMAALNVRNLDGYNERMHAAIAAGETIPREGYDEFGNPVTNQVKPEPLPYIVVVVDEMADLMMVAGKEIEACIQRLAQMARASGIHLIMATQRPSVDVITGTIKANFPTRISFQVTSKIDSRTILGEQGAEQLLGMGDMLFMAGGGRVTRIHGPFVTDEEVERIAQELRRHGAPEDTVDFDESTPQDTEIDEILGLGGGSDDDALYDQAVAIVAKERRATISYIQRRLQIGYNRAARLIEQMEEQSVVSSPNAAGKREVLIETR